MGVCSSRASVAERCAGAYQRAMAFIGDTTVMGGADCGCTRGGYFGGALEAAGSASKELREYESSLAAKAKEEMVRRLARAMARAGIAVNPDGELDAVVAKATAMPTGPERVKLFQEAFRMIYEDIVADVPLFHMVGYTRVGKRINYKPSITTNTEVELATIGIK